MLRRPERERAEMSQIEFSNDEKAALVQKLQRYFSDELEQDLGRFDAEFLLDFISNKLGPYFYNRGLYDAQALIQEATNTMVEAIDAIEKTVD